MKPTFIVALLAFTPLRVESMIPDPVLPLSTVNTSYDTAFDRPADVILSQGDDLQNALNSVLPGQIIELEAGATFTGNYIIPPKSGSAWIYIRSSRYQDLPEPGRRVSPAHESLMPKIMSPNEFNPTFIIQPGANKIRLIGLDITTAFNTQNSVQYGVMRIGWLNESSLGNSPSDNIIIDRCYIHGSPLGNVRDGIVAYNVTNLGIIDSYIAAFKGVGYESHALHLYCPPGPTKIANNYIEAGGINVFIGDSALISGFFPRDIEIVGNHIRKPLSWKIDDPSYAGIPWTIKNLVELKAGERIYVHGNVMENSWVGGQHGEVIVMTPRGGYIRDVTVRQNLMRNFQGGTTINSADVTLDNVLVDENIFFNNPTASNFAILMAGAPGQFNNVSIKHNTFVLFNTHGWIGFNGGSENELNGLDIYDNLATGGIYYYFGNGMGVGLNVFNFFTENYNVHNNGIIHDPILNLPVTPEYGPHFYARNIDEAGFMNTHFGTILDFVLKNTSPFYRLASDGKDMGADILALAARLNGVESGTADIPQLPIKPGTPGVRPVDKTTPLEKFVNVISPSNPEIQIPCHSNVRIFNQRGKRVTELVCSNGIAIWNGNGYASGSYNLFRGNDKAEKVVIMK